jgi:hypothetical protein
MSLQNFCRKPLVKVAPETNITEACRLMEQKRNVSSNGRETVPPQLNPSNQKHSGWLHRSSTI